MRNSIESFVENAIKLFIYSLIIGLCAKEINEYYRMQNMFRIWSSILT